MSWPGVATAAAVTLASPMLVINGEVVLLLGTAVLWAWTQVSTLHCLRRLIIGVPAAIKYTIAQLLFITSIIGAILSAYNGWRMQPEAAALTNSTDAINSTTPVLCQCANPADYFPTPFAPHTAATDPSWSSAYEKKVIDQLLGIVQPIATGEFGTESSSYATSSKGFISARDRVRFEYQTLVTNVVPAYIIVQQKGLGGDADVECVEGERQLVRERLAQLKVDMEDCERRRAELYGPAGHQVQFGAQIADMSKALDQKESNARGWWWQQTPLAHPLDNMPARPAPDDVANTRQRLAGAQRDLASLENAHQEDVCIADAVQTVAEDLRGVIAFAAVSEADLEKLIEAQTVWPVVYTA